MRIAGCLKVGVVIFHSERPKTVLKVSWKCYILFRVEVLRNILWENSTYNLPLQVPCAFFKGQSPIGYKKLSEEGAHQQVLTSRCAVLY